MPYTAIVNTYLAEKPLFGNAINTTTQFMLNIIGTSANTPVSSSSIDYPTVEDPDPIVIPDDPTPAPPEPPAELEQSLEGWSCYSNYLVHKNEIIGEVTTEDESIIGDDNGTVYIGSCADAKYIDGEPVPIDEYEDYELWEDEVFSGEPYTWSSFDVPAGWYGDGIAAKVTFSNGVQGFVYLSLVPPALGNADSGGEVPGMNGSQHMIPYGTPAYNARGPMVNRDLEWTSDADFTWKDTIIMDNSSIGRLGEYQPSCGFDYLLYRNHDPNNISRSDLVYRYTVGGKTFHLYFVMFRSNSELDYPLTITSNVPSLTVDFPFIACDSEGNPLSFAEQLEGHQDEADYSYYYHTDGNSLIQAIVQASGLTVTN